MNEETLALANEINRSLRSYRDLKTRLPSISDNILYEFRDGRGLLTLPQYFVDDFMESVASYIDIKIAQTEAKLKAV
jgi:hypothetical protein